MKDVEFFLFKPSGYRQCNDRTKPLVLLQITCYGTLNYDVPFVYITFYNGSCHLLLTVRGYPPEELWDQAKITVCVHLVHSDSWRLLRLEPDNGCRWLPANISTHHPRQGLAVDSTGRPLVCFGTNCTLSLSLASRGGRLQKQQ